jgi:hypothetical protein
MSGVARITRPDGRSNQQVVIDLVQSAKPGTLFTFEQLIEELARETDRDFDRTAVTQVVNTANRRLLTTLQRCLHNVRGQGYRVALATDHLRLAEENRRRSRRQLSKGLLKLQNVAWDELPPAAREAHEGTLMIVSAQQAQINAMEKRLSRIEAALGKL